MRRLLTTAGQNLGERRRAERSEHGLSPTDRAGVGQHGARSAARRAARPLHRRAASHPRHLRLARARSSGAPRDSRRARAARRGEGSDLMRKHLQGVADAILGGIRRTIRSRRTRVDGVAKSGDETRRRFQAVSRDSSAMSTADARGVVTGTWSWAQPLSPFCGRRSSHVFLCPVMVSSRVSPRLTN